MIVSLPDEIERRLTPGEVRLQFAIGLYRDERFGFDQGSTIAGLSELDFLRELARRGIRIHLDEDKADHLFTLLGPLLRDADPEARCTACRDILRIDSDRAFDLVSPLLDDPVSTVRWALCGSLSCSQDDRAVPSLIRVLQRDPDPQVRSMAAYALGKIAGPAAIPALLAAMESDHEVDEQGNSPSWTAAAALDDMLGTSEIQVCYSESPRIANRGEPDYDRLRRLAEAMYRHWSGGRRG